MTLKTKFNPCALIFIIANFFLNPLAHTAPNAKLDWQPCDSKTTYNDWPIEDFADILECATLEVPLNPNATHSPSLKLALTRLPAQSDQPIGNLLIIAGGPGEHSLDFLDIFNDLAEDSALWQHFHIIGYAPRGINPSTPSLSCELEEDEENNAKNLVNACIKQSGKDLLAHIGTREAVTDIEAIRQALDEPQLSLLGYSYGTKVLTRYSERYPSAIRAAIFDGVVNTNEDYFSALTTQEKGFQQTFERFVQYCYSQNNCPFNPNKNPNKSLHQLLTHIDEQQLEDNAGEPISAEDVLLLMQDNLLWSYYWQDNIDLLNQLIQGKTKLYNELNFLDSDDTDESDTAYIDNSDIALFAINCTDDAPKNRNRRDYIAQSKIVDQASPYDNYAPLEDDDYLDTCFYWPTNGSDTPAAPKVSDQLPPLLFVAQRHDPTTPHHNAQIMANFFHAPLITREGDGHTLVFSGESSCVDDIALAYLIAPHIKINSQSCHD